MTHYTAPRLSALRQLLKDRGLDGFIVPHEDAFQGEYLPPSEHRLAWLTGFAGSAGAAVVLADKAALFVDGRYTLQAREQADSQSFEFQHLIDHPPSKWLAEVARDGHKIGFDPWMHTPNAVTRLREACAKAGATLTPVDDNPIDAVWKDRPAAPDAPILVQIEDFAGKSSADKRADLAAQLVSEQAHAAFLSAADSVSWLLNIRSSEVPYTPVVRACCIVKADGRATLFVDPARIDDSVVAYLGDAVEVRDPEDIGGVLDALGQHGKHVLLDYASAPQWVLERLEKAGAEVVKATDPCLLPKACKNDVELSGMREAHRLDGAALVNFLAWLDGEIAEGRAVTELDCGAKLQAVRSQWDSYVFPSFPAIVGSGPHGAIVHYEASDTTNRTFEEGDLVLIDSGGQYQGGTTDVTRTVTIGIPTLEMRRRFTQVLKGHIAVARARFPVGTQGSQLDTLARRFLWEDGVDYDHGTGHGVGAYLSVHEGPQRISKRGGDAPLRPGMVISNEPGYYKTDVFGIRIENLIMVIGVQKPEGAEKDVLAFEGLTLVPIDTRLIEVSMLNDIERTWLNGYHAKVREELTMLVDETARDWLITATDPV